MSWNLSIFATRFVVMFWKVSRCCCNLKVTSGVMGLMHDVVLQYSASWPSSRGALATDLTSSHKRVAFTSLGQLSTDFKTSAVGSNYCRLSCVFLLLILCCDLSLVAVTPLCMYTL